MRVMLKGIHSATKKLANGKTVKYYYAWRGGPRLKGEPGDPEFPASYHEAHRARKAPDTTTVAGLVGLYRGTPKFASLSRAMQAEYGRFFKMIEDEFGDMPVEAVEELGSRAVFEDWRDGMAANPRKADKAWSALRKVFNHALKTERLRRNPCVGGDRLWHGSRADKIWTPTEIALFKAKAPKPLVHALMLALWTGQRQGDLLTLPWSAYDGARIRLEQSKTGAKVTVLVYSELKTILDGMARKGPMILTNTYGRPWTSDGFKSSWGRAVKRAGIEDRTFHDLRGTFITAARRAGATYEEISEASGHSRGQIDRVLEAHYLARDEAVSDAVILKMERARK